MHEGESVTKSSLQVADKAPRYYLPPASAPIPGSILAALVAIVVALVLGVVYLLLVRVMPLVYLNAITCALYGAAVGRSAVAGSRLGRVRHAQTTQWIAIGAMGVGFVFIWVLWLSDAAGGWTLDPRRLARALAWAYENGTWSVGPGALATVAAPINGVMLGLTWLGEAVLLFAAAIIASRYYAIDTAICPQCRAWCTDSAEIWHYSGSTSGMQVKTQLEQRDWAYLGMLSPPSRRQIQILVLMRESCPRCRQTHLLSLKRKTLQPRGRFVADSISVMNKLVVSEADLALIAATPPCEPEAH
jgi:hypothetical protein